MSDQINQIQASYNATEDRVLLKIKTLNDQVYLAWVTRRFLALLLPAMHGKHPTTGTSFFDEKTHLVNEAKKEAAQVKGDYESEYIKPDSPDYPLGESPILLAKITFKAINTPEAQLILEPETGSGIQLPFNPTLLGALLKIFTQAIQQSDWNLNNEPILNMPAEARLQ